jgi:hypothetical protein
VASPCSDGAPCLRIEQRCSAAPAAWLDGRHAAVSSRKKVRQGEEIGACRGLRRRSFIWRRARGCPGAHAKEKAVAAGRPGHGRER